MQNKRNNLPKIWNRMKLIILQRFCIYGYDDCPRTVLWKENTWKMKKSERKFQIFTIGSVVGFYINKQSSEQNQLK